MDISATALAKSLGYEGIGDGPGGLLAALLPFAIAMEEHGETCSVDDAFVWEPKGDKPLVTFGHLRAAREAVKREVPGLLASRFWLKS